jgi:hypothetical protein
MTGVDMGVGCWVAVRRVWLFCQTIPASGATDSLGSDEHGQKASHVGIHDDAARLL